MSKDHFVDVSSIPCPLPLNIVQEKIARVLAIGDTLTIETNVPRAVINILDWTEKENHLTTLSEIDDNHWQIVITKNK